MRICEIRAAKKCSEEHGGTCEACGRYACAECFSKSYGPVYQGLCKECRRAIGGANYEEIHNQKTGARYKKKELSDVY